MTTVTFGQRHFNSGLRTGQSVEGHAFWPSTQGYHIRCHRPEQMRPNAGRRAWALGSLGALNGARNPTVHADVLARNIGTPF